MVLKEIENYSDLKNVYQYYFNHPILWNKEENVDYQEHFITEIKFIQKK